MTYTLQLGVSSFSQLYDERYDERSFRSRGDPNVFSACAPLYRKPGKTAGQAVLQLRVPTTAW